MFRTNPELAALVFTTDGMAFSMKDKRAAQSHATAKGLELVTVRREEVATTEAEAAETATATKTETKKGGK